MQKVLPRRQWFRPAGTILTAALIAVFLGVLMAKSYAQDPKEQVSIAMDYYESGNYAEAMPIFTSLIEDYKFSPAFSYSLNYYAGYCARALGDVEKAFNYMSAAYAYAPEAGDKSQLPMLHMFLGELEKERGNYSKASVHYQAAIEGLKTDGPEIATALFFLAEAYRLESRYDESIAQCTKAIEIAKRFNLINIEIACLTNTGEVYNESGDYQKAIKSFTEALTMAHNAQLPLEMANIHLGFGLVFQALEKNDLARQHYEEALQFYVLCANVANIPLLVDKLITLPPCTKAQAARAAESCSAYVESFMDMGDTDTALAIQLLMAHYQSISGENDEAANAYHQVFNLALENQLSYQAYESAVALASLLNVDSLDQAMEVLVRAQQFHSAQSPAYLGRVYAKKAELYNAAGYKSLAETNYDNAIASASTPEEKERYSSALKELKEKI